MIARIFTELLTYIEFVFIWMPGRLGDFLQRWYFRRLLISLGTEPSFGTGLLCYGPQNIAIGNNFSCWRHCTLAACVDGKIEIGDNVGLNANVYINACSGGKIVLGNKVLIGPNVVIRSSDHIISDVDKPIQGQGHKSGTIIIEDDVWIGANVTIVGDVRINKGAVVGAGAVVTKDVESYTIVGGIPARFIKKRGE